MCVKLGELYLIKLLKKSHKTYKCLLTMTFTGIRTSARVTKFCGIGVRRSMSGFYAFLENNSINLRQFSSEFRKHFHNVG